MATIDVMTRDVEGAAADHATKISSNGHMDAAFPTRILRMRQDSECEAGRVAAG